MHLLQRSNDRPGDNHAHASHFFIGLLEVT